MGVVHHSNYIRYMELARVDFLRRVGVMDLHIPTGPYVLCVLRTSTEHQRTCRFDDELEIRVEGRVKGVRLWLRYAVGVKNQKMWAATGETELALVAANSLQPTRFPQDMVSRLAATPLSPNWPPLFE